MESTLIDVASDEFLGQWKRLVSTTNWEKGRIVIEWRQALIAAEADSFEYSDEAWSRRVGNVTPQHVGRLRRVYERFGEVHGEYAGLYWSHFQAALDWNDAEMWLEGAVQSSWSIAQMRAQRWEALGAPNELKPRDEDIFSSELDEDSDPAAETELRGTLEVVHAPGGDDADDDVPFAIHDDGEDSSEPGDRDPTGNVASTTRQPAAPVRPFANLPSLPADVNDAFEAYKLCILRHKLADWSEISLDDLLASLDSLKELALAPAEM